MRRADIRIAALAGVLLLGAAPGCSGPRPDPGPVRPVVLIGLDGMEWEVAIPLLRDGRLPTLAGLMERGIGGTLESMRPTVSPAIWTTIATGHRPRVHGIRSFTCETPDGGRRVYGSFDRRVPAFWNILSDRGRPSVIIGWWNTFPAEPIDGVMVAQVNTLEPGEHAFRKEMWKGGLLENLSGQVWPPEMQEPLLGEIGTAEEELRRLEERLLGGADAPSAPLERRLWENSLWSFRSDLVYSRIAKRLLAEGVPFDVFAVYFGGGDVAGHRFWRYLHPELYAVPPDDAALAGFSGIIRDYYVHLDRQVGELLAVAPADCNVLVVSDHGMRPTNLDGRYTPERAMPKLISGAHKKAPPGLFVAAGPDIRRAGPAAPPAALTREELPGPGSVLDVAPTLLALLGLPVGRDMEGSVMPDVLKASFLEAHPVRGIDSYTPTGWYEARQSAARRSAPSEERIEQLRALGYLD